MTHKPKRQAGAENTEHNERDEYVWALAKRLHWKQEHLDPTGGAWEDLSDFDREFYFYSVEALLQEPDTISLYYGWPYPRDC